MQANEYSKDHLGKLCENQGGVVERVSMREAKRLLKRDFAIHRCAEEMFTEKGVYLW